MLTAEEKVEIILNLIKEHNISAYKISKNTSLSTVPIQNIIDGKTLKPRHETLDVILEYLENKIVNKERITVRPKTFEEPVLKIVAEPSESYKTQFNKLKIDDKLNLIYKELLTIKKTIQEN